MLENFQGNSWGSIPPLRMSSLLPHDFCHGRSSSRWLPAMGFSLWWLLLLWGTGSRCPPAQELWCMGFVVPWHVGSSQTRNQTPVSCIARWILNHWTTREVQTQTFWPQSHIFQDLPDKYSSNLRVPFFCEEEEMSFRPLTWSSSISDPPKPVIIYRDLTKTTLRTRLVTLRT